MTERLRNRLDFLENLMSSTATKISDAKFEEVRAEAVRLRDMLKILQNLS
ncbi:hypothetical protein J2Y45_001950 [Dyadobacter sp. BE34]|uniref:Uncharacterized protein n=1 Tax=Dyadobacter fermentans TaxID=94254 RepID=A0ABU1QX79_9BACT|nr:hypothetical protein [Dyadobacter fermentans]MDR7042499.1 hypothetical protein [Dyadobacter sp. BE242]MDR7196811.1 hypothetical protein [Dyadobacter sp. BE34]MDR7215754.1 hypothetical protein [Dyadobacter sp. BE31]MDR7263290.1 hypothetical protein [Dyadobacter sp. BE32]